MKEVLNKTIEYRKCKISYIINESENNFTAQAAIVIPDHRRLDRMEILPNSYNTLEAAEEEVLKCAKKWIDDVTFTQKIKKDSPK
jgi:hypothetical protein